jgi:glycoprotein endo-alpha-1,2-mannosidase
MGIFQLRIAIALVFANALSTSLASAQSTSVFKMSGAATREEVLDNTLAPYHGRSAHRGANPELVGSVMCGYQGWFTCPGDGADRGWHHWSSRGKFEPGFTNVDLWPDVSELSKEERYPTEFRTADGSMAEVYSSINAKTINRHFKWMKEHGIDGVLNQRFAGEVRNNHGLYHFNTVLAGSRASANRHGRAWAVMYDLSGLGEGETSVVIEDWKALVDRMRVGRDKNDKAYLHHNGKPVVAVWGIGFNDGRRYTLDECSRLIDFLQNDPEYGGFAVMIGVPSYWREMNRDCVNDPRLHEVIKQADIVSPWAVGRFGDLEGAETYAREVLRPDLEWCAENGVDYLPVVFPGFSWHNMNPKSPSNQIPRLGGKFLWKQFNEATGAGAKMVYVAMFDEVDEATAIFKCTNNPPVGESTFIDYEGLPSDHYLWLVGQGRRLLRGEIEPGDTLPPRR